MNKIILSICVLFSLAASACALKCNNGAWAAKVATDCSSGITYCKIKRTSLLSFSGTMFSCAEASVTTGTLNGNMCQNVTANAVVTHVEGFCNTDLCNDDALCAGAGRHASAMLAIMTALTAAYFIM
jgi:hypothetical protein